MSRLFIPNARNTETLRKCVLTEEMDWKKKPFQMLQHFNGFLYTNLILSVIFSFDAQFGFNTMQVELPQLGMDYSDLLQITIVFLV